MAQSLEDDVAMADGLDDRAETFATADDTRDRQAHENYALKLFMVKEKVMRKPSLDTIYYNQAAAVMTNVPKDLQLPVLLSEYNNSFPPELLETLGDKIEDVIGMHRAGKISDDIWQQHGTKLVMAWVFSKIDATKSKKAEVDEDVMRREAADTANAKAMAETDAASVNSSVLSQVPWDSPLLKGLLEPIAPGAHEPWRLMKDKTISRPHGKPWLSVAKYIKLLRGAPFKALMDGVAGGLVDALADSLGSLGLAGGAAEGSEDVTMEG